MYEIWFVIDEMWHIFILHSREYHRFCYEYFGTYIHHQPFEHSHYKSADLENIAIRTQKIQKKMEDVYDAFGPVVMRRWFSTYPKSIQEKCCVKWNLKD